MRFIFHTKLYSIFLFIALITATSFVPYANNVAPNKASYHTVKAKNGDGVFSLLRRYQLVENSCDVKAFYELNQLKKDQKLIVDKVYILPVLIYAYNGLSIRSSIKDEDWDKAVRVQKYNEFLLKNKLRRKSYRSSKILWVPHHEINCGHTSTIKTVVAKSDSKIKPATNKKEIAKKEVIKKEEAKKEIVKKDPPKAAIKNEVYDAMFGKKHARFSHIDNSLKNRVFYVVSGHGGPDPGAQCLSCTSTLCEDEYAYDVSLRLVRKLKEHGAIVHMIIQDKNDGIRDGLYLDCDKDETCMGKKIPLGQKARLKQRTVAINKLYNRYKKQGVKSQKAIMIHVDSNMKNKKLDTYFYYYKHSKSGKKLAYNLQSTFRKKYEHFQKNRGYKGSVSSRGLYMLRNTQPTAVYVELANIKNKNDRKRLIHNTNRQALANWLFDGMVN